MSTVTKPVMLNETGQQIKGTLEEIRDAITGSGSTHYPVSIRISTPPEKVDYIVGEQLDLTGIAVQAIYDNGVPYDVTGDTTFSPSDGTVLTASDTAITATWTWTLGQQTQTFTATRSINVSTVESIEVTTPPTTTEYSSGDTLDLTGIVVMANMSNNTQIDVTSQCTFNPDDGDTLSTSDTAIAISLTVSGRTYTATTPITVSAPIYGVSWDGSSSSALTRTDMAASFVDPVPQMSNGSGGWTQGSSPFDDISPWKDIEIVDDANVGKLVKIPKFYYKWTKGTGSALSLQISSMQFDGSSVSPAHMDRGDGEGERDYVYVGRYHCRDSNYKSITNATPIHQVTRANARTAIHNLGTDIWQYDYAMYWTICMLYLVEYADWNSQAKIGRGGSTNHEIEVTGKTDSMTYHTGTTETSLSTYGEIQYRYIEGLWSNVKDFVDGIYASSGSLYAIKNPSSFSDTTGGTQFGTIPQYASGTESIGYYIPSASGFEYALYPLATINNTNYDTYICDGVNGNTNYGVVQYVGGGFQQSLQSGLFYIHLGDSSGSSSVGCRLMKLPVSA